MSDNLLESLIDLGFDSCKALYNIVYVNNKEGWEILDNKFRGALSEKAREYYDLFKELFKYSSLDFKKIFINTNFHNVDKVYPELKRQRKEEYFDVYEFSVPIGMSIDDFEKRYNQFAQFMGCREKDISFNRLGFNVEMRIKNNKKMIFEYDEENYKSKGFKLPIGIDLKTFKTRYWDLTDPSNAHCYIAGTTRCGKSNLIRLIMCYLVEKRKCDVVLSLLNEKRVDLVDFKECKNVVNYTESVTEAKDILSDIILEIDKRHKLFSSLKGIKTIWDYRNKYKKIPIHVVVIEELSSYTGYKEFHANLRNIASRGAGAGVFLILTCQLPNADVLPNLTKNNIQTTFGGKCKDSIRSDIIVEEGNLHRLRGNGHFKVFDSKDYGTEIQSLLIKDEDVLKIANRNKKGVSVAGTTNTPDSKKSNAPKQ